MNRKDSRTKNTIRNMSAGIVSKFLSLIIPFIIRTIVLHELGANYVGISSLFSSILQVLSVAELGFSSAIVFSLYKPIAENDIEEVCEWLTLYKKVYYIVGTIVLLGGVAVLPMLPSLINGGYPENLNIYLLYGIYLINTVLSYFVYSYKRVILIAYQRRDILSNIELVISILRSAIQIIILIVYKNYYLYIILLPIFTLVTNIVVNLATKKYWPEIICKQKINKIKIGLIKDQVKGVAIGKFSLVARNAFDSIILSVTCGLTAVTIYSNYYFVFSSIGAILAVINLAMSASVGNSLVTESLQKNYYDHNKFDFYYMWIAGWCATCLFCLYQPFMEIWVGTSLVAPFKTMILFVIYFYINQLAQIRSIYSEAAGLWWNFRYITLGEMIANILLNFILGFFFEMNGILLATIITAFFSSFIGLTIITFKTFFKITPMRYYFNNFIYMCVTSIAIYITYNICNLINMGLIGFILKTCICAFVPNVVYLIIYLCVPGYRHYLLEMIKSILIKKERIYND